MSDEEEFQACKSIFGEGFVEYRSDIKPKSLVVPRYSALPYYKELEYDCNNVGAKLINSYAQHKWIADFEWYKCPLLAAATFKTYTQEDFIYAPEGKYVVKGATNSAKWQWNTKMFASSKREAIKIGCDIREDSLLSCQDTLYREFVELEHSEIGINGLPFSNEWRFFFLGNILIDYGYYWSVAEYVPEKKDCPSSILEMANGLAAICAANTNFFVLDIALKKDGEPILIEINDGSMSGLSSICPYTFYQKLNKVII